MKREITMKVLVTGSTGFIGRHIVTQLLHQKYQVKVFSRSPVTAQNQFSGAVEISEGDIQNYSDIDSSVDECDYIIHLAGYAKNWAKDNSLYTRVNVIGTQHILKAALRKKIKKVLVTSTNLTIPPSQTDRPTDESYPPIQQFFTAYQESKCHMEKMIASFLNAGLQVVIVNPTRVFGPGLMSEANSVTIMIEQYLKGSWRFILGDGNARGNYAFISDVAQGHIQALNKGKSGERYLLGGTNLSFNEFFSILSEVSGKSRHMIHIPEKTSKNVGSLFQFLARHFPIHPPITPGWIDTFLKNWEVLSDKAIQKLNYRITPFPAALEKTIQWLNHQKKQKERKYEIDTLFPEPTSIL